VPKQASIVLLAALLGAALLPAATRAQTYPDRPVSILVPVAAGVGADIIVRALADKLSQRWNQQVVVVNRPGGRGMIAAQAVASAEPDGHTLYVGLSSAFVVWPDSKTKPPVDLMADLLTIGMISEQPMVIAASANLGVRTLKDFIAHAKGRPDELLYGATFLSVPHLTGELLNRRAGIKMRHIPTTGAARARQDVLAGVLHAVMDSVPGIAGALREGTVAGLAFTSDRRLKSFPELPLAAETLPDFNVKGWFVMMAPLNTPKAVVARIGEDLQAVLRNPELQSRYERGGTFALPTTAAEAVRYIKAERDLWRPVVREIGVK
jgi:tripartite-type tricarboxylate transporter receptor subunit TctC